MHLIATDIERDISQNSPNISGQVGIWRNVPEGTTQRRVNINPPQQTCSFQRQPLT